jgi:hypothetical protein
MNNHEIEYFCFRYKALRNFKLLVQAFECATDLRSLLFHLIYTLEIVNDN